MAKKSASKKKSLPKRHARDNKLLILLFILLAFVLVMAYMSMDFKKSKHSTYSKEQTVAAVNSSTVTIPDTSFAVTLVNGTGEFSDDMVVGTVTLSEPYFSVKSGSGYDTFAVMTYNTGGSGEFVAVALFQTKNGKATYRGSYPVGDRVVVEDITKLSGDKTNYVVNVNYLDREEDAPMTDAPTIQKTLTFNVDNHRITTPAPTE